MSSRTGTIAGRELAGFFRSSSACATGVVFLLLAGYFFYTFTTFYHALCLQDPETRRRAGELTLTTGVVVPLMEDLAFVTMLVMPFLTMGLLAGERKNGSLELLLTWPVRPLDVVAGKFLAVFAFYAMVLAPTLLYAAFLAVVADPDPGPLASGYLGLLLLGASCAALGLLFSSLTARPLVAALATFAALALLWSAGWTSVIDAFPAARWARPISFLFRSHRFFEGGVRTGDVLFFLAFTGMALLLAEKSVASRRWRA